MTQEHILTAPMVELSLIHIYDVPLRDIPSAAGNVLFYIPDKSAVGFVENVPGDKYTRVTFGDYVGYIERSYLSTTQD